MSNKVVLLIIILFISCNFSKEQDKAKEAPKKPTAISVVENAIDAAGSLERWKNIASLSYTKKSRLLLENGEIESEVVQRHHYDFRPDKNIKISWRVGNDRFLIEHNDSISQKFKNDSLVEEGSAVRSSVNSSLYVLGMPFKLLDKGTDLDYDGLKSINGIDTVHSINATYAPNKYQNHSTQDVWWYHFDKNNGAFLSSLVYHEPTYALIENLEVVHTNGLTFPGIRKSYRCDENGEKIFLRAEFWYDDYSVEFVKN